jgi:hypothetical protein
VMYMTTLTSMMNKDRIEITTLKLVILEAES